jgi:3-oxoacyl-[acyl-carrier-protein] synthase-3
MALLQYRHSCIQGICAALPEQEIDNWSEGNSERQSFITHTGIRYRRLATSSESIEENFLNVAGRLLNAHAIEADQVAALVVVTQTPSLPIPSVACQLQGELGLSAACYALDINMGCSGFVYGMQVAASVLEGAESGKCALVLAGDFSSRIVDPIDAATSMIFSDAAAGALLSYENDCPSTYLLETIGKGSQAIYSERIGKDVYMRLNGIDVFAQSLGHVPNHLRRLWEAAGLIQANTLPHYLHQANKVINQAIGRELQLSSAPSSIERYGNTSSASIPITMMHQPCVGEAILCGFGVGFSVASAQVQLSHSLTVDWL